MTSTMAIVLAAGKGTRMESDMPKVLVPACGKPLIEYVLNALDQADVDRQVVVVGYKSEDVRKTLVHRPRLTFVEQTEQLGTGHAVQVCWEQLKSFEGPVLIITGDSPLTQPSSLRALLNLYANEKPACILGTLEKEDPTGMGRIVRDEQGEFEAIVEHKDATDAQRRIKEVNMSTYVFDCAHLRSSLNELKNDNVQSEYYITDCPGILKSQGQDVRALPVLKPCEALSVNNLADLAKVEQAINESVDSRE